MKDKILFWLDNGLVYYGLAYFLNQKHDCEIYSIIETHEKPKKFYKNQKLIPFRKIWFFNDNVSIQNKEADIEYLSSIEKKYGINMWLIAYAERFFAQQSRYHKFAKNEILYLIEQECKLFEQVLDEVDPNFLIMRDVDMHHVNLLHQICKARGIKILSLFPAKMGSKWIVSDTDKLNLESKNSNNLQKNNRTLNELQNYLKEHSQQKWVQQYVSSSKINFLNKKTLSSILYLFFKQEKNEREKFMSVGRTRSKVFFVMLSLLLKRKYRQAFLDHNSRKEIKSDEKFVFFPLHVSPERYVDISAPFFSNQLEVIKNIARSLPVDYKLYVKEHFAMVTRYWREISFYKEILELPNVELIHPSVSSEEIIKKSSLVMTITGTAALQAAFFEKPSIVMSHVIYLEFLPFIRRIKNLEDLPYVIRSTLKSKVDLTELNRFVEILEKETFEYHSHIFLEEHNPIFKTLFSNVEISESEMKSFLDHNRETFELLVLEHLKKMNTDESQHVSTNERKND
ncbi:Capsule polysaccharide biosynthesis protein [Marine Group I thaumarchaeote SCGC AAA799-P11]|uniref:Capsule polysaccharide biosynthesis protein n=1 Tax=Marine Group I thaumarchaeote SCGC AAA799-P11 TaxID=1502295 RepID=A0A087S304_9ARCH|nr:Capsule polysaccharide biosynthesis protein [Marine Group I thaumarchaeote SCGC AAA799-P11]